MILVLIPPYKEENVLIPMWSNDQRPPRGRLRIYPLHHGISVSGIGGGGGLQMILSGVEDNHTSVIVLVQKERGKTDHNQGNYPSSHYIVRRDQNLSKTNEHLELPKPQRRANQLPHALQ